MAISLNKIPVTPLTLAEVTQYTAPSKTMLLELLFCNTTAAVINVSVSIVPSAGAAATGNRIMASFPVQANDTTTFSMKEVLLAGDFVSAIASALGVNMRGSVAEGVA